MQTFELPKYAGKRGVGVFRNPKDVEEMMCYCAGNRHIWFRSIHGDAREAKVNGAVRRFKKDVTRIEVPIKYGLREYGTFTRDDLERILIPVTPPHPGNAPTINRDPKDSGLAPTLSATFLPNGL